MARRRARRGARSGEAPAAVPWPPVVVMAGAGGVGHSETPVVGAALRRAGVADLVRLTPRLPPEELAALEGASIGHIQPALADDTALAAIEALALGVPVICSRVGALPEAVGPAGIVVEPRDPARLASAIRVLWEGDSVARQVTGAASEAGAAGEADLGGRRRGDPARLRRRQRGGGPSAGRLIEARNGVAGRLAPPITHARDERFTRRRPWPRTHPATTRRSKAPTRPSRAPTSRRPAMPRSARPARPPTNSSPRRRRVGTLRDAVDSAEAQAEADAGATSEESRPRRRRGSGVGNRRRDGRHRGLGGRGGRGRVR